MSMITKRRLPAQRVSALLQREIALLIQEI